MNHECNIRFYAVLTSASERANAIRGETPPSRPMAILQRQYEVTYKLNQSKVKAKQQQRVPQGEQLTYANENGAKQTGN